MTGTEKYHSYAGLEPYKAKDEKTHLQRFDFVPHPLQEDEVEIEVAACGICGTDVHLLTDGFKRTVYPIVPGHEFIGKVTMIGSAVKDITIGQRVGVSPIVRSCNKCDLCTSHFGQLCAGKVNTYNAKYMDGVTRGGYADKVRVQATWAIPIPDNIENKHAPLLCAGITTYMPFKEHNIGKGASVGVIGIGGLGHLALQWGRAKECAKVLAISTSDRKKDDAFALGATDFLVLDKEGGFDARYARSLDFLLVCGSGKDTNWAKLTELIKMRGTLILLDLPELPVQFPAGAICYTHIRFAGSFIGSHEVTKEMLEFASEKNVRPWVTTVENTLEGVNQGVLDLMHGKAHYRIVIDGIGRK